MELTVFTAFHVALSLIGIATGLRVLLGLLTSERLPGWTAVFLITTILTSATGFGFPFHGMLPSHWTGVLSLIVLAIALLALYVFKLAGAWRWIYAVTATIALYLNVFVLIVQLFLKVPQLHALAPTQAEPPFLITQLVVLAIFVVCAILGAIRFHPAPAPR